MELTNELKARFKAQYWGQNVGKKHGRTATWEVLFGTISTIDYIELRPLSSITEEEIIEIMKEIEVSQNRAKTIVEQIDWKYASFRNAVYPWLIDYLRCKSFAIPFMGIPVSQWVEWGVVKLKTE